MIEKFENLNIKDLDVQELEIRLEMTMEQPGYAEAGWIEVDPPTPQRCMPGTGPGTGQPCIPFP